MSSERLYRDERWLREKYCEEQRTTREIASICGCGKTTVRRWLKRHNIDTRPPYRQKSTCVKYRDEEWLRKKYHGEELSTLEIADLCGCTQPTVSNWLEEHGIETRSQSGALEGNHVPTGEDHWLWRGGDSERYGGCWSRRRKEALKRANYACENPSCDEDAESLGQNPDVHHIVPVRVLDDKSEAHDLDNLVVLCRSCHKETEPAPRTLDDSYTATA